MPKEKKMQILTQVASTIKKTVIIDGLITDRAAFQAEWNKRASSAPLKRLTDALGGVALTLGNTIIIKPLGLACFHPGAGDEELQTWAKLALDTINFPPVTQELAARAKARKPIIDPITLRHLKVIDGLTQAQRKELESPRGISTAALGQGLFALRESLAISRYNGTYGAVDFLSRALQGLRARGVQVEDGKLIVRLVGMEPPMFPDKARGTGKRPVWEAPQTWAELEKLIPGIKIAPALKGRPIYIAGTQWADRYLPQHLADTSGLQFNRVTKGIAIPTAPRVPLGGFNDLLMPDVVRRSDALYGYTGGDMPAMGKSTNWVDAILTKLPPGKHAWSGIDPLTRGLIIGWLANSGRLGRAVASSRNGSLAVGPGDRLKLEGDKLSLVAPDGTAHIQWSGTIARAMKQR